MPWSSRTPYFGRAKKTAFRFQFIAIDPLGGIHSNAPIQLLHKLASQALPGSDNLGNYVSLELYAEVPSPAEAITSLIQQARADEADPPALIELAQQMMTHGYELGCEFVNILRHDFGQYWLRPPEDLFNWTSVKYFSKPDQRWFRIDPGEDFGANLLGRDWGSESERTHRAFILLKVIGAADLEPLMAAGPAAGQTFADEMVATALIELKQNRIRSAIVHAVIAYEIAAKRGLQVLLSDRLKGIESGAILEAISREVSTVTLGRVVLQHAIEGPKESPLDWTKIDAIYGTRNMIVHRGQRRMPPFEQVKAQVLEVRAFVMRLQAALRTEVKRAEEIVA